MDLRKFFCIFSVVKLCMALEDIWYPYQFEAGFQSREEFSVVNITSDDTFKLNFNVKKWKSFCFEKVCYLAGLLETSAVFSFVELNSKRNGFHQKTHEIECKNKPVDVAFLKTWDNLLRNYVIIAAVATQQDISWYKLSNTDQVKIWSFSLNKNVIHINIFQRDYNNYLLVITEHLSQFSAEIYQVDLEDFNFWLHQKVNLLEAAFATSTVTHDPDSYILIPQSSANLVLFFKFANNRYQLYQNFSSGKVDDVISFKMGFKTFTAFNGLNAGIYRLGRNIMGEQIINSHLESLDYWLSVYIPEYGKSILIAQRSLSHGVHKSFMVDFISYNGVTFEEHEDVPCIYFGEELGVNCLPGVESEHGIKGATAFSISGLVGLLIPRHNNISELFLLTIDNKKIENPIIKELQEVAKIKSHLEELISVQTNIYNKIIHQDRLIKNPKAMKIQLRQMEEDVNILKQQANSNSNIFPHFGTIVFTNTVEILGNTNFENATVHYFEDIPAKEVLDDVVLKNNVGKIMGHKTFDSIQTDSLNTSSINEINADDMMFTSENITVDGSLTFDQPLIIYKNATTITVNNLTFQNEIVDFHKPIKELVLKDVEVLDEVTVNQVNNKLLPINLYQNEDLPTNKNLEKFYIPANLIVNNLNGENFEEFLKQLCAKNIETHIPGVTTINGTATIKHQVITDYLNSYKFPEDYVFRDTSFFNVSGFKKFKTLKTNEVECLEKINSIKSSEIITLSTPQIISGTTTFKHLKLSDKFDVKHITGKLANKFLPNFTLLDTSSIIARVNFKNLEVEGLIILSEHFNKDYFFNQLSDIVYVNDKDVSIKAIKQFMGRVIVRNHLNVSSSSVNEIPLNSIVSKNIEQSLNITSLKGIATFGNVEVDGLYGGVNIKTLNEQVAKLDSDEYIFSNVTFEEDLVLDKIQVLETINNIDVNNFMDNSNYVIINEQFDLKEIDFENIFVEGNLISSIRNFDINDFSTRYLSLTKNQSILNEQYLTNVFSQNFKAAIVNNVDSFDLNRNFVMDSIKLRTLEGKVKIENFNAQQLIDVGEINGASAIDISRSFWKHGITKHNFKTLSFSGDVYFDEIRINKLSSVNFDQFIKNLVFKNETDVQFLGKKTFLEGITVEQFIETEKFNNVTVDNILTKHGPQKILAGINIKGNVYFDGNITVMNNINKLPMQLITDNYQSLDNGFQINQDIIFDRVPFIYNLEINELADNINVKEQLDKIVYKTSDIKMTGKSVFKNSVLIKGNARVVENINNINLPSFMTDVVMITKDSDITDQIIFNENVIVTNNLKVDTNMEVENMQQIDFQLWKEDAIYIDRGLLEGHYTFEDVTLVDSLTTSLLNDIDMSKLIILRKEQHLQNLSFDQVTVLSNVPVEQTVNGLILSKELENTVNTNSNEDINSDIEFTGDIFVEGNIELMGLLNNKQVDEIVTTNTKQELTAVYNFQKTVLVDGEIHITEFINGINITHWYNTRLKSSNNGSQIINKDWIVQDDLMFEGQTIGNCSINNFDVGNYAEQVETERLDKHLLEKGLIDDHTNLCRDLNYMQDKLQRQIYKFDYFEKRQMLEFNSKIQYMYSFNYQDKNYVIINERRNCHSHIFIYDEDFQFVKTFDFGFISQIISVYNNNMFYLVIRNQPTYSLCKVQGTNIWEVIDHDFVHLANIEDQDILQESALMGEFYAIRKNAVSEFQINGNVEPAVEKIRKWKVKDDNIAFIPRGLGTGLSLRTEKKIIKLDRSDFLQNNFSYNVENVVRSRFSEKLNSFMPSPDNDNFVIINVGSKNSTKKFLAVASYKSSSVTNRFDFITIYENARKGKELQKIATYKPSSLVSLEFHNGESLLAFMEDKNLLQVYEYKGIEGFKHKLSAKLKATKLLVINVKQQQKWIHLLGVVYKNRLTVMEAMMLGNQLPKNLECLFL